MWEYFDLLRPWLDPNLQDNQCDGTLPWAFQHDGDDDDGNPEDIPMADLNTIIRHQGHINIIINIAIAMRLINDKTHHPHHSHKVASYSKCSSKMIISLIPMSVYYRNENTLTFWQTLTLQGPWWTRWFPGGLLLLPDGAPPLSSMSSTTSARARHHTSCRQWWWWRRLKQ